MLPLTPLAVPDIIGELSGPLDLLSLNLSGDCTAQLSSNAKDSDGVVLYNSNIASLTTVSPDLGQAFNAGNIGGLVGSNPLPSGGQSPTTLRTPLYRYLYAFRAFGNTTGLTLICNGSEPVGGGVTSVNVTAPILNNGTATNPVIAISPATDAAAGSMSAADKTKLDSLDAGSVTPVVNTVALRGADGSIQAAGAGFTGAAGATASLTGAIGVNVTATTGNVALTATANNGTITLNSGIGAPPLLLGGVGGLELTGGVTGGVAIASGLGGPATSPNSVSISAASALALSAGSGALTLGRNSVTWTWPNADGTAGQALKTDGAGNLGWESVATPGKPWNYRSVTFANSPVTAAAGDWIDCDTTSGIIVVNGPSTAGATWGVSKSNAGANAVNVSLTGGGNINALATQNIAFQWGSYTLLGTGTGARITAST